MINTINKNKNNSIQTKPYEYYNTIRRRVGKFAKQYGVTTSPKVGRPKKLSDLDLLAALIYCGMCGVNDNNTKMHRLLLRELPLRLNLPHCNNFLLQSKKIESLKLLYLESMFYKADPKTAIADSCPMPVCSYNRASRHKASQGYADFGWSVTIGKYYGFKTHMSVNLKMQPLNFELTPANVYDGHYAKRLIRPPTKIFIGDNHYAAAELRQEFAARGIKLFALKRKNAKDKSQPKGFEAKYKRRKLVETAFSVLTESFNLLTSRARSYQGFMSHYTTAIMCYTYSRLYG